MPKITVLAHNPELKDLVEMKGNIVYATPDGEELALQMLKPRWSSGGKGFPLIFFIQGSGFKKPNQFRLLPELSRLARRGYVIASVTHRSCLTSNGTAVLQDVKSALRFLKAHAEEYDIDKNRVCALGTSSGGNAALMTSMTADDPQFESDLCAAESTRVQLVVACFPATDLGKMADDAYPLTVRERYDMWNGLADGNEGDARREIYARLSPITYAQPGKDYPPCLLLHGDADAVVWYDDTEIFFNQMDACGYDVEMVRVTDAPHEGSFWSRELLDLIFDFIERKMPC